ncbi:MAG: RHS repeat-associated core domain-containing protein [Anaerolineae bacterium]|nr:RHS repeat-associated core domain-containing protein [Anaerolineae bacterium]
MPDGTTVAYAYDHDGRRIQEKINDTQITNFLWDELSPYGDVIAEYDNSPTPQLVTEYHLANGQLLAQTRGADTHFYLQDGQMSVRMLADETGTVTDTYDYDAFGEIDAQTGSTPNAYLYTGQQYDAETGLYSLRARYYNPSDGRFLSRDSYAYNHQNPFELNRYSYAANSPITNYDPSGLSTEWGGGTLSSLQRTSKFILPVAAITLAMYCVVLYKISEVTGNMTDLCSVGRIKEETDWDEQLGEIMGGSSGDPFGQEPLTALWRLLFRLLLVPVTLKGVDAFNDWRNDHYDSPKPDPKPEPKSNPDKPKDDYDCDPKEDSDCNNENIVLYRGSDKYTELQFYMQYRMVGSDAAREAWATGTSGLSISQIMATSQNSHNILIKAYGSEDYYALAHWYDPAHLRETIRNLSLQNKGVIIDRTFISFTSRFYKTATFTDKFVYKAVVPRALIHTVALQGSPEEHEWLVRNGIAVSRIR